MSRTISGRWTRGCSGRTDGTRRDARGPHPGAASAAVAEGRAPAGTGAGDEHGEQRRGYADGLACPVRSQRRGLPALGAPRRAGRAAPARSTASCTRQPRGGRSLRRDRSLQPVADRLERTLAFRVSLWDPRLGVAEAMDTAQRGMGLDWPDAPGHPALRRDRPIAPERRLPPAAAPISSRCRMSARSTTSCGPRGAGRGIEGVGQPADRHGVARAVRVAAADDYAAVYERLLRQARAPVVLHWLGPMFDPALAGYWGTTPSTDAMQVALDVIGTHATRSTPSRSLCSTRTRRLPCVAGSRRGPHVYWRRLQLSPTHAGDAEGPF